jgi:hypothetical protein
MAEVIVIQDVQNEIMGEVVPLLGEVGRSMMHAFNRGGRADYGSAHFIQMGELLHGPRLEMGMGNNDTYWFKLYIPSARGGPHAFREPIPAFCWSNLELQGMQWRWCSGNESRVPTAAEVELAVMTLAQMAEHFAVGEWAKKGPGTISVLKKLHRALA